MTQSSPSTGVEPPPAGVRPLSSPSTDEPKSNRWTRLAGFLLIVAELAVVIRLVSRIGIESPAFLQVLILAGVGFVVHHCLPRQLRMPFFVALSIGSIALVFSGGDAGWGSGLTSTGLIVGIGLALIGVCHLPFGFWTRAALLAAAGTAFGVLRATGVFGAVLGPIWSILGAMFMFRLIVYLYDKEHDPAPQPFVRRLAYFFMIPNACFPLFPVVDYKTFWRGHYDADALAIYQKGVNWMTRGLVHLVLYKIVFHYYYIDAASVAFGEDVFQYVVTASLLYLRVSGEFHMVIGILHLFGFNLPETNRRYFLASSFTDYWRRVNIYWKDFVLKVFYYPASFRLKSWGPVRAMVAATAFSFVATWLLHAYQSFWIRGVFSFSVQDSIFWGVLGVLVVLNSVREARHGRRRSLKPKTQSWADRLSLGARAAGTFAVLSLLWSIWSADSMEHWFRLWTIADGATAAWSALALAIVFVLAVAEAPWAAWLKRIGVHGERSPIAFSFRGALFGALLPLGFLGALVPHAITDRLPEDARTFLAGLSTNNPNANPEDAMERGYYEDLMDVQRANRQLAAILERRPEDRLNLGDVGALAPTGDSRVWELAPSKSSTLNGYTVTTNRWGFRGREYEQTKPPGVYRIAVLDASTTMGLGVQDDETYCHLLESKLNERPILRDFARYEVLNFGMNAYSVVCDLITLEKKALAFQPDAVILQSNLTESYWATQRLVRSVNADLEPQYDFVREMVAASGINGRMPEQAAMRRLQPYANRLLAGAFGAIVNASRTHSALPIWFLCPRLSEDRSKTPVAAELHATAQDAGFLVLDVSDAFGDEAPQSLEVAPWDHHPNAKGQKMLADALYDALAAGRDRIEEAAKQKR